MQGRIKRCNHVKGYGFIVCSDGTDVFFHYTEVVDSKMSINEGDAVEFRLVDGERGLQASMIKVI